MTPTLTLENKNIRTERGTIINPFPVIGYEKITDNLFVVAVEDPKQDNDARCGVIDAEGKVIIPFDYEFISSADGFETNNLLVAETLDHKRVFINLKNNLILLRD